MARPSAREPVAGTGEARRGPGAEPARAAGLPSIFLATTTFFWGTQFWAIEIASRHAPPLMITALRTAPAGILLLFLLPLARARLPTRAMWPWAVLTAVIMVVAIFEGISEGAARAGPAIASVLANTTPFFVLVLGRIFLREDISLVGVAGLVLGFAGVVMMVSSELRATADTGNLILGMALALIGALGWGAGTLIIKWLAERDATLDMVGLTTAQFLVAGAILAALAFGVEGAGSTDWGATGLWGPLVWITLGGSVIAFLCFFAALKRIPATRASAWLFLVPVIAVLVDVGRGQAPRPIVLGGIVLAIAGVALVNAAPVSRRRS